MPVPTHGPAGDLAAAPETVKTTDTSLFTRLSAKETGRQQAGFPLQDSVPRC